MDESRSTGPENQPARVGIVLPPGAGRAYPMGRIAAFFKADGDETRHAYSISEWWLEPHTQGPGRTRTPKTTSST